MPGARVAVLSRNNSDDRLEVMTELPSDSPLMTALVGAEPESCAAIRLGRAHTRDGERAPLLECEICGELPGASLCTPSLVGGEVIGSVFVEREEQLSADDERRVHETVSQAVVLLPDSDREAAMVTAEKLRCAIAAVQIPGESCAVTASLGVAVMPDDAREGTELLRCADRALYAAKRAGRNRESAESGTPV